MNNTCTISITETTKLPQPKKQLIIDQFYEQCKGNVNNNDAKISKRYGIKQLPKSDFIILAQRDSQGNETILCGFLFLQIIENGILNQRYGYIDIVCSSKRFGKKLIGEAERFCKYMDCKYIKISALDYVRSNGFSLIDNFYKKMNYYHVNNPCTSIKKEIRKGNNADGYRMTKCLENKLTSNGFDLMEDIWFT